MAIFSAEPPQTEVPNSVAFVDGHTLRFTLDGQEYECSGTDPIGPPGLTSLWMRVERQPPSFVNGFWVAASDDSADTFITSWRTMGR